MRQTQRAITAYHEAGHAVASFMLGTGLLSVTIKPNDIGQGHCHIRRPQELVDAWNEGDHHSAEARHWAENQLVELMCGYLAQRRKFPFSNWSWGYGLDGNAILVNSDLDQVNKILVSLFGREEKIRETYREFIRARAERFIEIHWSKIEQVALELLDRKSLSADDVARACGVPSIDDVMKLVEIREATTRSSDTL